MQDTSAKHRASQLDWTTVLPRACLSLPFLTVCTALWGSLPPPGPTIPQPPKDPLSLIPSALMVIKSDLKGHSIPSCYCSPGTGNDSQNHIAKFNGRPPHCINPCTPTNPHYSLLCGHHVYIVTSSPEDGWELLRHPEKVGNAATW